MNKVNLDSPLESSLFPNLYDICPPDSSRSTPGATTLLITGAFSPRKRIPESYDLVTSPGTTVTSTPEKDFPVLLFIDTSAAILRLSSTKVIL